MIKYPHDEFTRVALPPAVADLSAPTLGEIGLGAEGDYFVDYVLDYVLGTPTWIYDIQCELTASGLKLPRSTSSVDQTPWNGDLEASRPARYGLSGAELEGFRFRPPDAEILWNAARFRERRVLVVRRGVPVEQDWNEGDSVEVYRFQFGKRTIASTGTDSLVTFTVPIFVSEDDDDAVVAA